jgi:SAM-dependent methyltransferase
MLQLKDINEFEWRRVVERLDRGVAEFARGYLARLHARHVPIRTGLWDEELDELRLAREPDYDEPGLPLVYALKYMPRRVVSVLGALLIARLEGYPSTALDVGSGTGATALALDLLDLPRHVHVTGIEPSAEMRAFAGSVRYSGRVTAHYLEGSVADSSLARLRIDDHDLLVFSATFPYHFDGWDSMLELVGAYAGSAGKMILVVEPEAKAEILDSFARRLRARGWPTVRFRSDDLPDIMKREDVQLKAATTVWERIGSPGSVPPRTWWSPPTDHYLIANPRPIWPKLGRPAAANCARLRSRSLCAETVFTPTRGGPGTGRQCDVRVMPV